ncbi:MAG: hypothetical protein ACREV9_10730 [Burkholderiales bacterium]
MPAELGQAAHHIHRTSGIPSAELLFHMRVRPILSHRIQKTMQLVRKFHHHFSSPDGEVLPFRGILDFVGLL